MAASAPVLLVIDDPVEAPAPSRSSQVPSPRERSGPAGKPGAYPAATTSAVHPPDTPPYHRADPDAPLVPADDLGLTRGDGVFDTAAFVNGRPLALDEHLQRFAHSAALLGLPRPRLDVWRAAVLAAVAAHVPAPVLSAKLVLTRGREGMRRPIGWVRVAAARDHADEHRDGITVVTLDRGYRHDVATTSPWLLQGAKTLSYAINLAMLREARHRGADDAIMVSADGWVLEGPTASVVLREGDAIVTPSTDEGILAGTTQRRVFDIAAELGLSAHYRRVRPDELLAADGVWLVSSSRGAAPVRAVDGRAVPVDRPLTDALNARLLPGV
ncbi:MAG: aminodeoxychorismate lyase [Pseudoclavibacter caeni]|jgi:4-amino-4-deoxychorismate lyase